MRAHALPLAVVGAITAAWFVPAPAAALNRAGLALPIVAAIFFCQGAVFDRHRAGSRRGLAALAALGALIAFVVAPALAVAMARLTGLAGDARVGLVLMACMGPTLASGVVIATRAGGETETALALTVLLNLLAVVLVPTLLGVALGQSLAIDRVSLFTHLCLSVLAPAVAGQLARAFWPALVARSRPVLRALPVALLALAIYAALGADAPRLHAAGAGSLAAAVPAAAAVHATLLVASYLLLRGLRLRAARATAAAVVVSQKTLPVALAVWAAELAPRYPSALLPPIAFHLAQVIGDGLIAPWWAKRIHAGTMRNGTVAEV